MSVLVAFDRRRILDPKLFLDAAAYRLQSRRLGWAAAQNFFGL
jgi:hypothetical protein